MKKIKTEQQKALIRLINKREVIEDYDGDYFPHQQFKKEFLEIYPDAVEKLKIGQQAGERLVYLKTSQDKDYYFLRSYSESFCNYI